MNITFLAARIANLEELSFLKKKHPVSASRIGKERKEF